MKPDKEIMRTLTNRTEYLDGILKKIISFNAQTLAKYNLKFFEKLNYKTNPSKTNFGINLNIDMSGEWYANYVLKKQNALEVINDYPRQLFKFIKTEFPLINFSLYLHVNVEMIAQNRPFIYSILLYNANTKSYDFQKKEAK